MTSADLYVRFLQLSSTARALPGLVALDPREDRILAWLVTTISQGRQLCVRDVMAERAFGAPATVHTRLKAMRHKGWIVLTQTTDARRKRVEITDSARASFERLGDCMLKALRR